MHPLKVAGSPDETGGTRKISVTVAAFRLWRGSPLLSCTGHPDRRHVPLRYARRTPSEKRSTPLKRVEAPFRAKAPLPPWSSAARRVEQKGRRKTKGKKNREERIKEERRRGLPPHSLFFIPHSS